MLVNPSVLPTFFPLTARSTAALRIAPPVHQPALNPSAQTISRTTHLSTSSSGNRSWGNFASNWGRTSTHGETMLTASSCASLATADLHLQRITKAYIYIYIHMSIHRSHNGDCRCASGIEQETGCDFVLGVTPSNRISPQRHLRADDIAYPL